MWVNIIIFQEFRGHPPTDDIIKKRDEALAHFLNFAVEFRVKKLSFSELTLAQLKLLTNTWQADCIDLYTTHTDLREFLQLDSVKVRYCPLIQTNIFYYRRYHLFLSSPSILIIVSTKKEYGKHHEERNTCAFMSGCYFHRRLGRL